MDGTKRTTFRLDELARMAGVAPRTVRYYVQRGLLSAPVFRGKDTAYSEEHLLRLRAIKRLQQHYLPLDEIQVRLATLSAEELTALVERTEAPGLAGTGPATWAPDTLATGEGPACASGAPVPVSVGGSDGSNSVASGGGAGGLAAAPAGTHLVRWVLAPGLELSLADNAGAAARALAHELMTLAQRRRFQGGGSKP